MSCEMNFDHTAYCSNCGTCWECIAEEEQTLVSTSVEPYIKVLKKILKAHKSSEVDWDAMKEAEQLIENLK